MGLISPFLSQTWFQKPQESLQQRLRRTGLDANIINEPECAESILKLRIHHIHQQWGNIVRWDDNLKQTQIKVENAWQAAKPFLQDLTIDWHDWKKKEAWWCCDQFGFHKRKAGAWASLEQSQIPHNAKLTKEQLNYAKERASINPAVSAIGERTCVIEVISGKGQSSFPFPFGWLFSGFAHIYSDPIHPFMRLIDKEGNVCSIGFWPNRPFTCVNLMRCDSDDGQFLSPDPWETRPIPIKVEAPPEAKEGQILPQNWKKTKARYAYRSITGIAIDEALLKKIIDKIQNYNSQGKKFQHTQNCTAFIADILQQDLGFQGLEHRYWVADFVMLCTPLFLQNLAAPIQRISNCVRKYFAFYIYDPLSQRAMAVYERITSFVARCLGIQFFPSAGDSFYGSNRLNLFRAPLPLGILKWQDKVRTAYYFDTRISFADQYAPNKGILA